MPSIGKSGGKKRKRTKPSDHPFTDSGNAGTFVGKETSTLSSQRNIPRLVTLLSGQQDEEESSSVHDKVKEPLTDSNDLLRRMNIQSISQENHGNIGGNQLKSSPRLRALRVETARGHESNTVNTKSKKGSKRKRGCVVGDSNKHDRMDVPLHNELGDSDLLGEDGNLFNCHICNDVGDVVCCDGCPKVYHVDCIPKKCQSRLSLDRDENPWYCPFCWDHGSISMKDDDDGNLSTCDICNDVGDVVCCDGCPKVYHVECVPINSASRLSLERDDNPWYCPKCCEKGHLNIANENEPCINVEQYRRSSRLTKEIPVSGNQHDSIAESPHQKDEQMIHDSDADSSHSSSDEENEDYAALLKSTMVEPITSIKATSPFHLYIIHNRLGIERYLLKDNDFKRAKKGMDRNFLIAKEAARRWRRSSILERKKYIDQSMQDYEKKLITWKEDLIIRDMMGVLEEPSATAILEKVNDPDLQLNQGDPSSIHDNETQYWENRLQQIQALSKLHAVPIKVEPHQNTLLFQLLKDQRFEHIQLISPCRSDVIYNTDKENSIVNRFMVQGPTSTLIGDSCAGCDRGWNHFCPVVKRIVPAVERRVRMQQPVSSLMATRVGIGCFNHIPLNYSKNVIEGGFCYDEVTSFLFAASILSQNNPDNCTNQELRQSFLCPRCKTKNDLRYGCLSCRRIKLLKAISRSGKSSVKAKMMPHSEQKLNTFTRQKAEQSALTMAMLENTWKPNAVMPFPHTDDNSNNSTLPESDDPMTIADDFIVPSSETACRKTLRLSNRLKFNQSRQEKSTSIEIQPDHCQDMAVEHRDESVALQKHCLSIAILGILSSILRRDALGLFAKPVPDTVESYRNIVPDPIDFSIIRSKALEGKYTSLGSFTSDVRKLCKNALVYNLPGSIYAITANEIYSVIDEMQTRAIKWMTAIRIAHAAHFNRRSSQNTAVVNKGSKMTFDNLSVTFDSDLIEKLRRTWPGAVEILENSTWLRKFIASDILRTKENESALYGAMAIRRAGKAAKISRAAGQTLGKLFSPCLIRNDHDDESLRGCIDSFVSEDTEWPTSLDQTTWRERLIIQTLKSLQDQRLEEVSSSKSGCARCEELQYDDEGLIVKAITRVQKSMREVSSSARRVDNSRVRVKEYSGDMVDVPYFNIDETNDSDRYQSLSVRGSHIHGWGLFAEKAFKKGEVVAEYIGEWIGNGGAFNAMKSFIRRNTIDYGFTLSHTFFSVADARERRYKRLRIQDYQFRVSSELVVDATMKGGCARYINHSCEPNCIASITDEDLKRIFIVCERNIEPFEEITYDYQFPLELSPELRIPCTCGSNQCRGFMNWDVPECHSYTARNLQ
jgi:hypothetical protein